MNLSIFNCLTSRINLQLFSDIKLPFSKGNIFRKQRRMTAYRRRSLVSAISNSLRKIMTCYLWDTNRILRYRTLCTSILKSRFLTKRIKVTRFVLLKIPGAPHAQPMVYTILVGTARKFAEYKWNCGVTTLAGLISWWKFVQQTLYDSTFYYSNVSLTQAIPLARWKIPNKFS